MFFLLLIILLLLLSVKGVGGISAASHSISISVSSWLRGVLVLLVVLHHLDLSLLDFPFVAKVANSCGKYAVCIFFFLSGSGLMLQYRKKGRAMFVGYARKRVSKLAIPILTAWGVFALFYYVRDGQVKCPDSLGALEWFVPFSWFVYELAVMYLLFWAVFRFLPARIAHGALYGAVVCMMVGFSLTDLNDHWWISSLSFPIGCSFACAERFLAERRCVVFAVALLLFALRPLLVWLLHGELLWPYALMAVPAFLAMAWCFVPLLKIRENSILSFLGGISYEMYLYQGLCIALLKPLLQYHLVYTLILFVLLVFVGWGMHKGDSVVISRCLPR